MMWAHIPCIDLRQKCIIRSMFLTISRAHTLKVKRLRENLFTIFILNSGEKTSYGYVLVILAA